MPSKTYIYLATPWGPIGGGMFKVADYLIQAQLPEDKISSVEPQLKGLDTRGNKSALFSILYLIRAIALILGGRFSGKLAGVHINMAERLSVVRKGILLLVCRAIGIPVVLHLHAAQLHLFYHALPKPLKRLVRLVFQMADRIIVLGQTAQTFLIQELGVSPDCIEIVTNGVPRPLASPQKSSPGNPLEILFLGNLSERKGVSDLLNAAAQLKVTQQQWILRLAGGGDISHYENISQQLGLCEWVKFEGWANSHKAAQLLANADILVLPSYDEGLPLVILEALANQVAVICTPVGEIPNFLAEGVDVAMVNPGDIDGIASALTQLINDPAIRLAYMKNGTALYEKKFSVEKFFDRVAEIHLKTFGICAKRK